MPWQGGEEGEGGSACVLGTFSVMKESGSIEPLAFLGELMKSRLFTVYFQAHNVSL